MFRSGSHGARGVTIVEFALVFPLLLLLMFMTIDFGFYFFVQHTVQYATREGVRLALVGRTINDAQGNALSREASIIQTIRDKAAVAVRPADLSISIFPLGSGYSDPTGWQTTQNAGDPGVYMRVRTRYTYRFLTPLVGPLVAGGSLPVQAQATYRNELFE
jgi:Flp pilus assembly protein TadG